MSIAENFEVIADAVYEKGIEKGIEKGKKDEHDKFWDNFQDADENGEPKRTYYEDGFKGNMGWTKDNFYPKYDIKPVGSANQIFYAWETGSFNLKQRLEECKVVLDTSKATSMASAFNYSKFTELPTIDLSAMTTASSGIFANNYGSLTTIEKLKVSENTAMGSWFGQYCQNLTNLIVEGTIAKSGFNVQYQKKLTTTSLLSILTALSKDKSIATGKSVTFADNHLAVVQADEDCLEQLSSASTAGWTIFFGTIKYEG